MLKINYLQKTSRSSPSKSHQMISERTKGFPTVKLQTLLGYRNRFVKRAVVFSSLSKYELFHIFRTFFVPWQGSERQIVYRRPPDHLLLKSLLFSISNSIEDFLISNSMEDFPAWNCKLSQGKEIHQEFHQYH